jgi:hypothetical protein
VRFVIGFYEMDRTFGGPEEGGWWYETGSLVRLHRVLCDEAKAHARAARANRLLERVQCHSRPLSSVAYDGGRYRAIVWDGNPPPVFPVTAPHYC